MTQARQLHHIHQRAGRILTAALASGAAMRGDRRAGLFEFTFADGSRITLQGKAVSLA